MEFALISQDLRALGAWAHNYKVFAMKTAFEITTTVTLFNDDVYKAIRAVLALLYLNT